MEGRTRTVVGALAVVGFGVGLCAISVPLYRLVCEVTGYAGTPKQVASNTTSPAAQATTRHIVVRWDSNVMPDMPWSFYPEQGSMDVKLGETNLAVFKAVNRSDTPIVGTAVFNVVPLKAAQYVNKIQCFCFTQQRLDAGEKADLPVSFFIDPKIATDPDTSDVGTITLSYTFYKSLDQNAGKPAVTAATTLPQDQPSARR